MKKYVEMAYPEKIVDKPVERCRINDIEKDNRIRDSRKLC